jgi:YHS domain-containing protein
MTSDIDPVCGMVVDRDHAVGQSTFGGRTFFFCSSHCQKQFEETPARYAGDARGEAEFEKHEPPHTKAGGVPLPKFGSAGAGGLEYEPGPEKHVGEPVGKKRKA